MLQQQMGGDKVEDAKDEAESESEQRSLADEENQRMIKRMFPLEIGDLCVLRIGVYLPPTLSTFSCLWSFWIRY